MEVGRSSDVDVSFKRLLTWGEGETVELSIVRKNLSVLARVDLEPTKRNSVLSLLSFKKLDVNQDLISSKQSERAVGGESGSGFGGEIELGVIRIAVKLDCVFSEDMAER